MANFTAEERETSPSAGAKPGEGPPICPTPFLPNAIDNVAMTFYLHRHKTHSLKDCLRVGYFNPVREMLAQQLRSGGEAFIKVSDSGVACSGRRHDDGIGRQAFECHGKFLEYPLVPVPLHGYVA